MSSLNASFYDGVSSHRHDVVLELQHDGFFHICGEEFQRRYHVDDIQQSNRLGKVVRSFNFNDGARLELDATPEIDEFLDQHQLGKTQGLIHKLEHNLKYIAIAVVVTLLSAWGFLVYGIPTIAERVAYSLPADVQNDLGEGVLDSLDNYVFTTSELSEVRQQQISEWFDRLKSGLPESSRLHLEFRKSELLGANALALPSGTIVVTDGLVQLSENDMEVASVLAHEIGHIHYRHSLRGAIQNSGVAIVIALMIGDVSTASSFAVALPTILVNMKYSRGFESEADDYARELMQKHDIPLHYFADILTRLGESHDAAERQTGFFDSHPAVQERIQQFRD